MPAVRAVQDRETIVDSNLATDPHGDDWQKTALLYGYRSVTSAPLMHNDVLYGVLTIYSRQAGNFDDMTVAVLTELGELIGYALNTINQRNALLSDGTVDLTFGLTGADGVFIDMASRLSTTVQIKNISTRSEETFLVHFTVEDADVEQVKTIAEGETRIREVRSLSESDPMLFEAITIGECIATEIAKLGASLRSVALSDGGCECEVSVPQNREIQTFVGYLKDRYPDIEVKAQQNTTPDHPISEIGLLNECLTDRQRDILTTAYYSGYFDDPRGRTGAEIAGSLGISQSAVSKQLRVAQNKLLTAIFE